MKLTTSFQKTKHKTIKRIFFDASVIVAGFLSSTGASRKLITLVKQKKLHGITSATALDETIHAITAHTRGTVNGKAVVSFVETHEFLVHTYITQNKIEPYIGLVDSLDAHVIAGALLTRCDYLVSLDRKHLVAPKIQKSFSNAIQILTPGDLIKSINLFN